MFIMTSLMDYDVYYSLCATHVYYTVYHKITGTIIRVFAMDFGRTDFDTIGLNLWKFN